MEVLTEMDEYFNAMSKINLDETVMPYVKGRLVESDTYNKVQKILNTPELEKAHMFCYDLDLENLEECEIAKINNLYKLGVDRGFIVDDLAYQDCDCTADGKCTATPSEEPVKENPRAKIPCFVAMYSAMKDGQIKTGEAYSRAISVEAAKADVKAQLSKFGYSNISILAIEATEEDACACTVSEDTSKIEIGEDDLLKGRVHNGHLPEAEEGEVKEDDLLKNRPHNNHLPEAEDSEDDSAGAEDDSAGEDDSASEDDSGDTSSDAEDDGTEPESTDDTDSDDSAEDDGAGDDSSSDDAESNEEPAGEDNEASDGEKDEETSTDDGSKESSDAGEDGELDDNKKADLKDNYKKVFKNTMLKCKFEDKSFDDLTLKEKVKFFTELSKTWQEDYEPSAFMSDKEVDQLNKIVIKK